ncbi:hypothetical protein QZM93_30950 [Burkholderia cepacia]|uniref:hypothetical protein n=1 Tax=Burkholderia cepacia TaxID=292 RepID=UPI0011AD68E0|nr:hypothetical protein [Burkholderia cepacia]MDN7893028.1 hypothetical protein [Burkholderia cepacia]
MTVDIKTAKFLATNYLAGTVIAILIFAGGFSAAGWKLWSEYKQLDERREMLQVQEQKFSKEQVDFEKYRSTTESSFSKERADIAEREFVVSQREKKNQDDLTANKQNAKQNNDTLDKIQAERVALSATQLEKAADDHMSQLISEFSTIGVDLSKRVSCSDSEAVSRYNRARVKLGEIIGFADAHDVRKKYGAFINGQSGVVDLLCRPSMAVN